MWLEEKISFWVIRRTHLLVYVGLFTSRNIQTAAITANSVLQMKVISRLDHRSDRNHQVTVRPDL
jgi:hypothetical protein